MNPGYRSMKVVTVVTKTGDKEGPKRWNKPKKHTKTQEVN